jgi:hypothetical protein
VYVCTYACMYACQFDKHMYMQVENMARDFLAPDAVKVNVGSFGLHAVKSVKQVIEVIILFVYLYMCMYVYMYDDSVYMQRNL